MDDQNELTAKGVMEYLFTQSIRIASWRGVVLDHHSSGLYRVLVNEVVIFRSRNAQAAIDRYKAQCEIAKP